MRLRAVGFDQPARHLVAQRRRGDRVALHRLETHALAQPRERMAAAAQEGATQLVHVGQHQVGRGLERARIDHQRIEAALAQRLRQQVGAAACDHGAHGRMVRRHVQQKGRHQQRARPRAQPDAHRAALAFAHLPAAVAQRLGLRHQKPRALQHLAPEDRELVAPTDAVEQRHAQLVLERAHAAAERGLRQVQRLRRLAERARVGQRNQVPQLNQRHGESLVFMNALDSC